MALCFSATLITSVVGTPDTKLFPWCRQRLDQVIRKYGERAGIHPDKCHMHALRHSLAIMLWDHTGGSIGLLQRHLRHKSASSSLVYLYESDARKASAAVARGRIGALEPPHAGLLSAHAGATRAYMHALWSASSAPLICRYVPASCGTPSS